MSGSVNEFESWFQQDASPKAIQEDLESVKHGDDDFDDEVFIFPGPASDFLEGAQPLRSAQRSFSGDFVDWFVSTRNVKENSSTRSPPSSSIYSESKPFRHSSSALVSHSPATPPVLGATSSKNSMTNASGMVEMLETFCLDVKESPVKLSRAAQLA